MKKEKPTLWLSLQRTADTHLLTGFGQGDGCRCMSLRIVSTKLQDVIRSYLKLVIVGLFLFPSVSGITENINQHGSLSSSRVDADLEAKLRSSSPFDTVTVDLSVFGGIEAAELNRILDSTCTTLSQRRQSGVLILQERANKSLHYEQVL